MKTRTTNRLAVVCALAALTVSVLAQERGSPEVLREYDEANQAPDYVVFRSFLRQMSAHDEQRGDYDGLHFVQDSLDIAHDDAGNRRAKKMHAVLTRRHRLMTTDIERAEKKMLCGKSKNARTEEEVYAIVDEMPEVRERIAEKHYLETITTMDNETAQVLDAAIQEQRKSFGSTRFSAREMFGGSGIDVFDHVEEMCRNLDQSLEGKM